jgi:nucleoside-specific outer membrane channel protein Tsx
VAFANAVLWALGTPASAQQHISPNDTKSVQALGADGDGVCTVDRGQPGGPATCAVTIRDGLPVQLSRVTFGEKPTATTFPTGATGVVTEKTAQASQKSQTFSVSDVQLLYGGTFHEPGVTGNVPKNTLTFENTANWGWGSSYLFVDILRSWTDADQNAKEVYGEWYPTFSLRHLAGKAPGTGFVRDVGFTLGLNSGVRSTGPAPFVILPGTTLDLKMPGFKFFTLGVFAYIDLGQFQGQPTGCHATTYQITPAWALPIHAGSAAFSVDGFVDFIGSHADCEAMVLSQPQFKIDLSNFWHHPGRVFAGLEFDYWHNKYGISGLQDTVWNPIVIFNF